MTKKKTEKAAGEYKSVPVQEAKTIAEKYDKAQVLIFAWEDKTGRTHITTYGTTLEHKIMAEKGGDRVAQMLGLKKGTVDEDYVSDPKNAITERLGLLVDKAENIMSAGKIPMPANLHLEGMKGGLKDIRDELKNIFFELGGDKDTWAFEVNYDEER